VSSSCSTSAQLSTALKDAQFGCSHVSLYGQQTGAPMAHRMGIYKKMAGNMHSGHPTYVFKSHQFGLAYLYYENLTPSEEYWVVGPTIGSRDANLGVSDKAMSADKITGVWHVADVAKGTFDMAPSIFIECARARALGGRATRASTRLSCTASRCWASRYWVAACSRCIRRRASTTPRGAPGSTAA
jgi:hypothetical protein